MQNQPLTFERAASAPLAEVARGSHVLNVFHKALHQRWVRGDYQPLNGRQAIGATKARDMTERTFERATPAEEVRGRMLQVAAELGLSLDDATARLAKSDFPCGPGWTELHDLWVAWRRLKAQMRIIEGADTALSAFSA